MSTFICRTSSPQRAAAQLNLSAVTQSAVRRALAALSTDGWLRTLDLARAPGEGPTHSLGLAALDAAREESPTRLSEALVVDASAIVDLLLGNELGAAVQRRLAGTVLHAPAHLEPPP